MPSGGAPAAGLAAAIPNTMIPTTTCRMPTSNFRTNDA
jgi:hypothetical protein